MMKMKTLLVTTAIAGSLAFTHLASAANPGAYVGAGLGLSKLQTPSSYAFNAPILSLNTFSSNNKYSQGGLGGRIFAGFNFNKYFGLEAGLATYATSKYSATLNGASSSIEYKANAFDLVGKGYLPIGETGFNVYALAGIARLNQTVKYNNGNIPLSGSVATPKNGSTTYHNIRPIYGIGASYDVNAHFTTSVELTQIYKSGNMKSSQGATPNANMLTINAAYNFG